MSKEAENDGVKLHTAHEVVVGLEHKGMGYTVGELDGLTLVEEWGRHSRNERSKIYEGAQRGRGIGTGQG